MDTMLSKISKFQRRMKNMFDPFEGRRPRVLLLGLDGAGKTTLLYKSKLDDTIYANVPPRGINIEHMTPKRGASMQLYDMAGNKMSRLMWQQWFRGVEALVYVVDGADKVRIDEAKYELHELLKSRDIRRVPVIVAANKQDLEDSLTTEEVKRELDLDSINDRDWSIFGTSARKGTGISKVFKDTVDKVKAFRHYKSGLQIKPDSRRSSKKSVISERSEETKSVSNCSSIEDPVKVKSLFESINEQNGEDQVHENDEEKKDNDDISSGASEQTSDASAKYDKIAMGTDIAEPRDSAEGETESVNKDAVVDEATGDEANDTEGNGYSTESSVEQEPRSEEDLDEAYENKTYDSSSGEPKVIRSDDNVTENLV